jgi:hypothetical protein
MDNFLGQKYEYPQTRNIIAKGWSGMLFLLFLMMIADIVECGIKNDFSFLTKDPGSKGLWFIVIMTIINVSIQISVQTFESKKFRWFVFSLTLLYTLFFIGHQVVHLVMGEGIDIHFFLDITHHLLGIWAVIFAYKWAKYSN